MYMKARISEVFDSIQGEGLYLGEKQIFVRFFGCNLSCKFCDTKPKYFKEYEPKELLEEIKLYGNNHHSISFTGGEPLLQNKFLKEILALTAKEGRRNYLETNGTLPGELEEVIDSVDIIAMDVKLPSSTGMVNFWPMHKRFLKVASRKEVFIKAIICKDTLEEELREALTLIRTVHMQAILVLQPNSLDGREALAEKLARFKNICREEKVSSCVIPQIHKFIGVR